MSTASLETRDRADYDVDQYRALHAGAVAGAVLAVVTAVLTFASAFSSPVSCILVSLLNLAPLAVCIGALARIRSDPGAYIGLGLARCGLALSLLAGAAGVGYGAYAYLTEVPPGYARISFFGMKPDAVEERGSVVVPPEILALNGKPVFIKGFIRPDSIRVRKAIDRFLLVRDNQQCCFGDVSQVKYYDQIAVEMTGSRRLDYSDGLVAIGGVLRVVPENAASGSGLPVFTLRADYVR
jgi:hypothetical protein